MFLRNKFQIKRSKKNKLRRYMDNIEQFSIASTKSNPYYYDTTYSNNFF